MLFYTRIHRLSLEFGSSVTDSVQGEKRSSGAFCLSNPFPYSGEYDKAVEWIPQYFGLSSDHPPTTVCTRTYQVHPQLGPPKPRNRGKKHLDNRLTLPSSAWSDLLKWNHSRVTTLEWFFRDVHFIKLLLGTEWNDTAFKLHLISRSHLHLMQKIQESTMRRGYIYENHARSASLFLTGLLCLSVNFTVWSSLSFRSGTLTQFILVLYGTGSASSSPPEQAPSGNDNCKTLDLRQICIGKSSIFCPQSVPHRAALKGGGCYYWVVLRCELWTGWNMIPCVSVCCGQALLKIPQLPYSDYSHSCHGALIININILMRSNTVLLQVPF